MTSGHIAGHKAHMCVIDEIEPYTESQLVTQIRATVGGHGGPAILWRNSSGQFCANGRTVHYGLCVGSADLIGIRRSDGRFIAIEVKTTSGRVSQEQHQFIELVRANGGLAGVARSVEEAMEIVNDK